MNIDWYSALVSEPPELVLANWEREFDFAKFLPGRPSKSYNRCLKSVAGDTVLGEFLWGGTNGDASTFIETRGYQAREGSRFIREQWPQHRNSRIDVCEDYTFEGAWEQLSTLAIDLARDLVLNFEQAGDWILNPSRGRTLYIGGRRSMVRLCVYEKGKRDGGDPNWVRVELRIRPDSRNKGKFCALTMSQLWGASRWSQLFFQRLTGLQLDRVDIARPGRSDFEGRHAAMLVQYGKHLIELSERVGGWSNVGPQIQLDLFNLGQQRTSRY